jgi:hypothetical protein
MFKKVSRFCVVALLVFGVGLAVANFSFAVKETWWGSMEQFPGHTGNPGNDFWLYDDWYCFGKASTCCVVFGN